MTHYHIDYGDKNDQSIHVAYTISNIKESIFYLQLPAWRPGRYELGNFGQFLFPLTIKNTSGEPLSYKKVKKDRWEVFTEGETEITIEYTFEACIKNAGGTFKTANQLVITPVNCLLYAESRIFEPCTISVNTPTHFDLASAIEKTMYAENYYELAASPIVFSSKIQRNSYTIDNINFHICLEGNVDPNWDQIIPDFENFTRDQLSIFSDFPSKDYYFLILIFDEKHYHGVEHLDSTLIALGPAEDFSKPSFYQNLLGISSHELFHYWNICRIRPKELQPYNYTRENYFDTGYVAEGVTTYYGDYLLGRSKVFSEQQLFFELGTTIRRHLNNPGRKKISVAESSIDLWLDGYKAGVKGRKVSIYAKGASIAFLLDLWIRKESDHTKSLDDVMLLMWERFGATKTGYTSMDYQQVIEAVLGSSIQWYFDDFVYGIKPVEEVLFPLLEDFGMEWSDKSTSSDFEKYYGIQVEDRGEHFFINKILPEAEANTFFKVGDEILTINLKRKEDLPKDYIKDQTDLQIGVRRDSKIISRSISKGSYEAKSKPSLKAKESMSSEQKKAFYSWLNIKD